MGTAETSSVAAGPPSRSAEPECSCPGGPRSAPDSGPQQDQLISLPLQDLTPLPPADQPTSQPLPGHILPPLPDLLTSLPLPGHILPPLPGLLTSLPLPDLLTSLPLLGLIHQPHVGLLPGPLIPLAQWHLPTHLLLPGMTMTMMMAAMMALVITDIRSPVSQSRTVDTTIPPPPLLSSIPPGVPVELLSPSLVKMA